MSTTQAVLSFKKPVEPSHSPVKEFDRPLSGNALLSISLCCVVFSFHRSRRLEARPVRLSVCPLARARWSCPAVSGRVGSPAAGPSSPDRSARMYA